MSEFRQDFITKKWVVIAPGRAKRPAAFAQKKAVIKTPKALVEEIANCPFCAGNEQMTPPEVYQAPKNNGAGWEIRVVPNKFPTFEAGALEKILTDGIYTKKTAPGGHEVIITADHHKILANFSQDEIIKIIDVFIARYQALKQNLAVNYILIFENQGVKSGASVAHPHFQLMGFSNIENSFINDEICCASYHFNQHKKCVFCEMLEFEKKENKRIIFENQNFISLVPYAARSPFEFWILPKTHQANFENLAPEEKQDFAQALQITFEKLYKGLNNPDYNSFIHTAPVRYSGFGADNLADSYHWHLEVLPDITIWGGFEFATDMIVNPMIPEEAAEFLRNQ